MKVLFTIQHPADVHLFRRTIKRLEEEGDTVKTVARENDINIDLLEAYDIEYESLAGEPQGLFSLPFVQFKYELGILNAVRKFDPDVLVGMCEPGLAHAGTITNTRSIVFTDTEHATLQNKLTFPFVDRIYTPECYEDYLGEKQVRYPGYHELAYLHPDGFEPDESVLEEAGVETNERIVILRLVSWDAAHDIGSSGLNNIVDAVESLEAVGATVLITAEGKLPAEIEDRQISIAPSRIHHLMYYADLFVGESATMIAESAVLGTPAVYISSIELGYLNELEQRYGLVFNYTGENRQTVGMDKITSLLQEYNQVDWQKRRTELLNEKTNTTDIIYEALYESAESTNRCKN